MPSLTHDAPLAPTLPPLDVATPPAQALDFETVFREHAPYVLRVLPRMGVAPADVEDVAQEIFVAVYKALPGFEGRSRLRTWVYGITLRVCASYRRRAHRQRMRVDASATDEPITTATPERALRAHSALHALDDALEQLSDPQREVFVLFEIEGVEMREIARLLGCSRFTAYSRLYAARKHVRQALAGHEPGEAP